MQRKQSAMTVILKLAACALLLAGVTVRADDTKADPTGTWTWSTPGRNGGPDRTNTLSLKVDASKLTGTLSTPGRGGQPMQTAIADGTVDGDAISFAIVRERNGNSMTNKYSGKVAADKITGKMEFTRDGDTQSRDWTATKSSSTSPSSDAK
jgi:hypothetical protein